MIKNLLRHLDRRIAAANLKAKGPQTFRKTISHLQILGGVAEATALEWPVNLTDILRLLFGPWQPTRIFTCKDME